MARHSAITLSMVFVGLSSLATPNAHAQSQTGPRRVIASIGVVRIQPGQAVRVSLVESEATRDPRNATLRVIDGRRQILSAKSGNVSPTKALFLDVRRSDIPSTSPQAFPAQFEADFSCGPREYGPTFTVELYDQRTGKIRSAETCGNPCCPACAPRLPLPGIPSCPTRELPLTSAPNP